MQSNATIEMDGLRGAALIAIVNEHGQLSRSVWGATELTMCAAFWEREVANPENIIVALFRAEPRQTWALSKLHTRS